MIRCRVVCGSSLQNAISEPAKIARMSLVEEALALLLRSPRLEVSTIIELLDVGDREFREIVKRNTHIATLLDERRCGRLEAPRAEPTQCAACDDWFLPYAAARFCSDGCRNIARLQRVPRSRARSLQRLEASDAGRRDTNTCRADAANRVR